MFTSESLVRTQPNMLTATVNETFSRFIKKNVCFSEKSTIQSSMSSKLLFDNDSESDDENRSGFNTNKDYAKSYNKFRSKELLKKGKQIGV